MKPYLLAILAGASWGVGEVFTKSVLHSGKIGPITAITVRSAVALPVLLAVYLVHVHFAHREPAQWWVHAGTANLAKLILGSGLLAGAAGMVFFYLAIATGDLSRVKPIAFTLAPAVGVTLAYLTLGEPLSVRKIIALVLVLVGVGLLTA